MSSSSEQNDSDMEDQDQINENINDTETETDDSDDESNDDGDDGSQTEKSSTKVIDQPMNVAGIIEKYNKLKGKQLFLLFPKKLPQNKNEFEKMVKSLNSHIIKATQPRQKSSRYCLIEFENESDRKKAIIEMKKVEIDGKKIVVKIPKTDDEEFIKKIAENKAAKNLKQREKLKLKKLAKQEAKKKSFTSTLIVSNIPSSATVADVKKLFPDAVELRFTLAKGVENTSTATVSLPSPRDASNCYRKKLKIEGNELKINFSLTNKNTELKKQKKNKKKNKNTNVNNATKIENITTLKNDKKRKHDVEIKNDNVNGVSTNKKEKLNKKKKNISKLTKGKKALVKKPSVKV